VNPAAVPSLTLGSQVCPYLGRPCDRDKCLAFSKSDVEQWKEIEMKEHDDGDGFVRKSAVTTGRVMQGKIVQCRLGVFDRMLMDVEQISETQAGELITNRASYGLVTTGD
jgi:hypothetical protein